MWGYVLAVVLFAGVLMLADALVGWKKAKREGQEETKGISGFRRSIIGLTAIVILAIAVFKLLEDGTEASQETVDTIVSILAGLIAAIAGFYFGGRAVEGGAGSEKRISELEKRIAELSKGGNGNPPLPPPPLPPANT